MRRPDDDGTVLVGRPTERARLVDVSFANVDDWTSALSASTPALPEQSSAWVAAMCRSRLVDDVSRAYRFDDGRTVVLPLVRRGIGPVASWWSPLPAWGVGGPVGDVDGTVVDAIVDDLRRQRVARIGVRIDEWQEPLWTSATRPDERPVERCVHVIEMQPTLDEQFALLSKTTRRNIRRALDGPAEIRVDRTGGLLDDHYELYLRSVERWADQQREPVRLALARARRRDPLTKLRAMQDALGDRCVTLTAFIDGRPAASIILLLGATARDTRGAMDIDIEGASAANAAIQWRAICQAYDFGSRRYHMGETGRSSGLATFKEKFGATPRSHHEFRFERLPLTRAGVGARTLVKRIIGFEDT